MLHIILALEPVMRQCMLAEIWTNYWSAAWNIQMTKAVLTLLMKNWKVISSENLISFIKQKESSFIEEFLSEIRQT